MMFHRYLLRAIVWDLEGITDIYFFIIKQNFTS